MTSSLIAAAALLMLSSIALDANGARAAQSPPAAAASGLRDEDLRVATIAYRLGLSGAPYCPEPYPLTGLLLHHLPEYDEGGRGKMIHLLELDRGPGVLAVVEGSPAARAGLVAGDVIVEVNGNAFPSSQAMAALPDAAARRKAIERSEALLEAELRKGIARLSLLRNGGEIELRLDSSPGCPARIRLARSSQTSAFATGRYVIVTTALLQFIRNDDELAVVVGHELAHNILHHPARLDAQQVPRGFLRGLGKNASRVRVTEEEADRLGLKLTWSAGYDIAAAIPFWRRYYARFDTIPQLFRTHPSLEAREQLIEHVIADLPSDLPMR